MFLAIKPLSTIFPIKNGTIVPAIERNTTKIGAQINGHLFSRIDFANVLIKRCLLLS